MAPLSLFVVLLSGMWRERTAQADSIPGELVTVDIGASEISKKCVFPSATNVQCAENAGDKGIRINPDYASASYAFIISVSRDGEVCAQSLTHGQWSMNLQISCIGDKATFVFGNANTCPAGSLKLLEDQCREVASQLGEGFLLEYHENRATAPTGCYQTFFDNGNRRDIRYNPTIGPGRAKLNTQPICGREAPKLVLSFHGASLADVDPVAFEAELRESLVKHCGAPRGTVDQLTIALREGSVVAVITGPEDAVEELQALPAHKLVTLTVAGLVQATPNYTIYAGQMCHGLGGQFPWEYDVTPDECKARCDRDAECFAYGIRSSAAVEAGYVNECVRSIGTQCGLQTGTWDHYVKQASCTSYDRSCYDGKIKANAHELYCKRATCDISDQGTCCQVASCSTMPLSDCSRSPAMYTGLRKANADELYCQYFTCNMRPYDDVSTCCEARTTTTTTTIPPRATEAPEPSREDVASGGDEAEASSFPIHIVVIIAVAGCALVTCVGALGLHSIRKAHQTTSQQLTSQSGQAARSSPTPYAIPVAEPVGHNAGAMPATVAVAVAVPVINVCEKCGTRAATGYGERFCHKCGAPLRSSGAAAPPAPTEADA